MYVRDEIITQGIEETASPTLIAHDIPGGVVASNAYAIKWLQRALNYFHRKYPFANDITTVAMTALANTETLVLSSDLVSHLPSDFILDVRDGLIANDSSGNGFRLTRQSYQYFMDTRLSYTNTVSNIARGSSYCVVRNSIKLCTTLENTSTLVLHYYALPAQLEPEDFCDFPDEECLVKYLTLRGLEWANHPKVPPGTAQQYLAKQIAGFRSAGLLHEPEYEDGIPVRNSHTMLDSSIVNRNSWMGPTVRG